MTDKTKVRVYYMLDRNGNRLEASRYSGYFEKYGISNIAVLFSCAGMRIHHNVTFKSVDYEL